MKREAQKFVHANEAGTDESKISACIAAAGAQEQCRRIAVDLQDVARKLAKKDPSRLDELVQGKPQKQLEALALPSTKPSMTFHAGTLPAAYVEFPFCDCCPFLDRPKKTACKQFLGSLPWREELEYSLAADAEGVTVRSENALGLFINSL